jgi:hypothetical protein
MDNRRVQARFYHNESGQVADDYTVCYRSYRDSSGYLIHPYASMSGTDPMGPGGVFMHGIKVVWPIDNWGKRLFDYQHLGKRVTWNQLPEIVRTALKLEREQAREAIKGERSS